MSPQRNGPDLTTGDLAPGLAYRAFVEEALRHRTEASFRASRFFERHGSAIVGLLAEPRIGRADPAPPAAGRLRVVQWNIEKGKDLEGLTGAFLEDPYLREASIACLQEVDLGTARCGNADVAGALAAALGAHAVYLPGYLECTRGVGDDLLATGENRLGLHGLAILSRLPVLDARAAPLPDCFDYFRFSEKRFGGRRGLYALLESPDGPLAVATTHLEVRNSPDCRARQFAAFLAGLEDAVEAWGRPRAAVVTGDWNTNTFRRGGLWNAAHGFMRIVRTPPSDLARELTAPAAREPLFDLLRRGGFAWDGVNDAAPTASEMLGKVEDLRLLPPPLADWVMRRSRLRDRLLQMRLDWIAVRGLTPVGPPRTLSDLPSSTGRLSDHAPIGVDLAFAAVPAAGPSTGAATPSDSAGPRRA